MTTQCMYGFICECNRATQCYWQTMMDSKSSSIWNRDVAAASNNYESKIFIATTLSIVRKSVRSKLCYLPTCLSVLFF